MDSTSVTSTPTIPTPKVEAVIRLLSADLQARVFLAEWDQSRAHVTLHAREGCDAAAIHTSAEAAVRSVGLLATISVRTHGGREMAFPRSVEAWLRKFCSGQPVYDPTGVARRALGLLEAARAAKARFGDLIAGMYFDPVRRELLVRNRRRQSALGPGALADISAEITRAWSADETAAARVPVRSIDRLPNRTLIPVEDGRFGPFRGMLNVGRMRLASGATALSLVAFTAPATAKPDSGVFQAGGSATQSESMVEQFGLLAGLSLFADGGPNEAGAFGGIGLDHYFGPHPNPSRTRTAQWRWFWEKEFWDPELPPRPPHDNPYGGY